MDILVDGVKKSNQSKIKLLLPKVGDLVVINYSSPIDGLFAAMITKSNWSRINILIPDNGKLYKYSIWSLFAFTFTGNHTGQVVELEKLTKSVNFLLLEGTPSNNSAILPFVPVNVSTGFNVKSVVVKYAPSYFSLPVPHVSKFRYIFELLTVLKIEKNFIKLKVYDFGTNFNVVELKKSFELNSLNVVESRLNLAEKGKFWESFNKKAR